MSNYAYDNYKTWVNDWISGQPKNGYGVLSHLAKSLDVNSVVMSQIFRGDRDLNLEQAVKVAQVMTLTDLETDLFLLLVQKARAGSADLVATLNRQIKEIRKQAGLVKNRIEFEELTAEDQGTFYSSWLYVATWLAITIPEFSSLKRLSQHFNVPEERLQEIVSFLIERGLTAKKGAHYTFGRQVLHLSEDLPIVSKHHTNWRMKALMSIDRKMDSNLHYSAPMVISESLQSTIKEELLKLIQKTTKRVIPAPSEKLVCLNIDLFEV